MLGCRGEEDEEAVLEDDIGSPFWRLVMDIGEAETWERLVLCGWDLYPSRGEGEYPPGTDI